MPGYFFDSSALGKRYHPEVGTAHVEALFQAPQPARFMSRLSVVELQSVFAGKMHTRAIIHHEPSSMLYYVVMSELRETP
jgi:hypothetical protein